MASAKWNEITSTARSMEERIRSTGSVAWYRGERDASWRLKSTLHRYIDRRVEGSIPPLGEDQRIRLLREHAKTLYREFKGEAWPLLANRERSNWGVLFAMQHFSIPTRLLDWTENFACAVFFAQFRREPACAASIWVLDPIALNRNSYGLSGIVALDEDTWPANFNPMAWHPSRVPPDHALETIAVAPIYTNPRMVPQQARFTAMGDSFLPLDEQRSGSLIDGGHLRRLILPPETFHDAEEFLASAGISAFSFFPDLQGLALKHETRLEQRIVEAKKFFPDSFSG